MLGCSQSPRDVTTANLLKRELVKNIVGLQKSDQELRVSYKPTAFRRWVVDIVGQWEDYKDSVEYSYDFDAMLLRHYEVRVDDVEGRNFLVSDLGRTGREIGEQNMNYSGLELECRCLVSP